MKTINLFLAAALLLLIGCSKGNETQNQAMKNLEKFKYITIEHPNTEAPSFTLTDNKGAKFTDKDLRGKVYLLQGFAPGCSSCAREIATLNKIYDKYKEKGIEIISLDVASNDISGTLETKERFNGGDWHWTVDLDNVAVKFGIASLESTYIVDKNGVIRYKDESISDADILFKEIDKLI